MSCDLDRNIRDGYRDGELDAVRTAEFERHLEHCPDCVAALEAHEALRACMDRAQLYRKADPAFRKKIRSETHVGASSVVLPRIASWRWFALAAAFLLVAYAGWRMMAHFAGEKQEAALVAEVVDAHLRSLQPGHLTDVLSSDQHTVKPWFAGRLDFSPLVRDLASDGFPLQGGRLDIVHGRTVAALVYGRRKHLISVFVWPSGEPDMQAISGTELGYNWVLWRKGKLEFCAVSDVNLADLNQLHESIAK